MLVSRSVCSMHDVSVRRVHVFHFWVLRGTFWIFTCHFSSASLEGKETQICLNNGSWCCQISRKSSETLKFCMCVCVCVSSVSGLLPMISPWCEEQSFKSPCTRKSFMVFRIRFDKVVWFKPWYWGWWEVLCLLENDLHEFGLNCARLPSLVQWLQKCFCFK